MSEFKPWHMPTESGIVEALEPRVKMTIGESRTTGDVQHRLRRVGAQDFHAAFDLGADNRHISTLDADGVALAAIQELHQLVREKEQELDRVRIDHDARIESLQSANSLLLQHLNDVNDQMANLEYRLTEIAGGLSTKASTP